MNHKIKFFIEAKDIKNKLLPVNGSKIADIEIINATVCGLDNKIVQIECLVLDENIDDHEGCRYRLIGDGVVPI